MSLHAIEEHATSQESVPQRLKPRCIAGVYATGKPVALTRRLLPVEFMVTWNLVLPLAGLMAFLCLAGCGYHQAGAASHVPAGVRTLAVPIFQTKVQAYRTETDFTQAVVRELNTRTKYRVLTSTGDGTFTGSGASADATLRGTILTESIAPLTYDPVSGQTSSYLVTVTAQVTMTAHDGTVLYRNDAFAWREQYQSTQDLTGFLQEDGYAIRRLSRDFAQAVVSDMLESF